MIKQITNRLFLLVTMLLLSTVNALAQTASVAEINGVQYATLQEAFDAVANDGTITLLADLTQDDGVNFDREGIAATLDLNGKTFTVNSGSSYNYRAIRIDNGTLTVQDGSINAVGSGTTSANGTGCYGAFRVEANGKLIASNLQLTNARPWGLNVKVLGGEAELTNVTINSSYGGGIEVSEADLGNQSKPGKATLTGCTFTQTNYYDHCSTPLSVSGGSELVVNSGTYTSENHVLYVFSSGGYVTVNGGQFIKNVENNHAAFIAAIDTNTYPAYTGGLKLNAGNFTGNFSITSPASTVITGGTYSVDPTAYVADGYEAVNNNNGTWTVQQATAKVAQIGTVKYATLQAAVDAATAGQTITLLKDFTLTTEKSDVHNVVVNKSLTIDGDGHTITSSSTRRPLAVSGKDNQITLKNMTVVNMFEVACLNFLDELTCTLDHVTLDNSNAKGSYNQPITINTSIEGNGKVTLNITNGSVIKTNDDAMAHYAIIVMHPANINITNSTIKGWAAVYVKALGTGTDVTISNSTLESHGYSGYSNAFGMFVTESDGNSFTLTDNSYKLTAGDNYDVLFMLKGYKNNTIQLLGSNNTFVSSDPYYGGLTSSWGDFYTNSLYMSEGAKNLFASYIDSEATINQVTEGEYSGLYKIGYVPEVYYYWNTTDGQAGGYYDFSAPFVNGWLANGEFIDLLKNITLSDNITCKLTAGSFEFTQGEYSVTKGDYSVLLHKGVSVNTDKETDIFASADEDGVISMTVTNNVYTYTCTEVTDVAQIGTVKYATLAEAIAAANATGNVTINLLRDYDFEANEPGYGYTTSFLAEGESAPRNNMLVFSADDITFDLGGHTISNLFNNTFKVTGSNVTFQNGGMRVGQLYYSDLNGNVYTSENQKTCSYIVYVVDATNFTVNSLTTYGGINVSASTATINDLSFSGTKFYAVCSQSNSTVTLNGGTYTKAITGAAGYMFWVQAGSVMNIVGGTYTKGSIAFKYGINPVITGGTFDFDPTNYGVADGYEAVANNNNTWTVGEVVTGTLTAEEGSTDAQATYSVQATVQDAEGETLATKTEQTVTVSIVTEADDDKKVASDAAISKLNMETVVAKAITTEAAAVATAAAKDINVSIAVVSEAPAQVEKTYTYEVYPEATVTVTVDETKTSSTVKLANSDLKENQEFTFTLDVNGKFEKGATVKVVHKSADYADETFNTTVSEEGKVSITVSHFSAFELSEYVTANISAVGFATFSSTKAVDFTGIDAIHAYTAEVKGNKIEFTRILKVPANTGLLLRNPNGGAVSVGVPVIASADFDGTNHLVAVNADIADGDLDTPENGYKNFILNKVDGVVGFYRPAGKGVDAGRAYLKAPASEVSGVQSFTNLFDGETTAIDSITTADEQTQDNVFYDLSGRRVNNPQRGLYIVNGKKVLVK